MKLRDCIKGNRDKIGTQMCYDIINTVASYGCFIAPTEASEASAFVRQIEHRTSHTLLWKHVQVEFSSRHWHA